MSLLGFHCGTKRNKMGKDRPKGRHCRWSVEGYFQQWKDTAWNRTECLLARLQQLQLSPIHVLTEVSVASLMLDHLPNNSNNSLQHLPNNSPQHLPYNSSQHLPNNSSQHLPYNSLQQTPCTVQYSFLLSSGFCSYTQLLSTYKK